MDIINYKINTKRKHTIAEVKKILNSYKEMWLSYLTNEGGISYLTQMGFYRYKTDSYPGETYILTIYKGKEEGFDIFNKDLLIDERHEFHNIEEIIDYLDIMDYLEKKKWIVEEDLAKIGLIVVEKTRLLFEKCSLNDFKKRILDGKNVRILCDVLIYNEACKAYVKILKRDLFCVDNWKKTKTKIGEKYHIEINGSLKNMKIENNLLEEKHEFNSLPNAISYLDKKGYLKKEEWIKNEKK